MINELGFKKVALITAVNSDFSVSLSKIFKDAITEIGGEAVESRIPTAGSPLSSPLKKPPSL